MTLRLVGLISIVLLLSLAAFGLLMGHYQEQVMQEVEQTASAVGKATLRTLELSNSEAAGLWQTGSAWVSSDAAPEGDAITGEMLEKLKAPGKPRGTIMVRRMQQTGDGKFHEQIITGGLDTACDPEDGSVSSCMANKFLCSDGMSEALCEELRSRMQASVVRRGDSVDAHVFVDLEEVSADRLPATGKLVLRIPTVTPSLIEHTADHSGDSLVVQDLHAGSLSPDHGGTQVGDPNSFHFAPGVIQLPIAVDDYDQLFQSIRGRSLFLFFGVFVVGMVLSTGLAARFTRPIRTLDSGIRRLSEGDLDVRVDVHGKDEIARLGMAFNDMADKLKENRDRSREMVRREKLSALGGLAAGVAHDVRNPLHSIGLTLQHLRETCRPEGEDRGEDFDRSMDIIRGEIRRLDELVTSFLRFSKSENRERQEVDLADLLQETARLIQKEAEWRGIDVRLNASTVTPAILADGEALRASILNLVLNSFNAMPEGGRLTLTLSVQHDSLVVEVADDGHGIPEEEQEKVFEFAYSTREGGSGLGLAMVHQCIVEEHGGTVSMNSKPDEGTTVRLSLPIHPPARPEVS